MEAGPGPFSVGKVFTFLVLTFGPFNVLAPFVSMTSERDTAFRRRLALEGTLIAAFAASASVSALAFALAFPTIVTPYGIAVLVLLMTLALEQSPGWRLILGVADAVLVIDLITMLNAQRILKAAYVPAVLGVVGTVMAALQIALAVQAVVVGLRLLRTV